MSYAGVFGAFGEATCPPGWTFDASSGSCKAPATITECPSGFTQKVPGECWPTATTACKSIGSFFNPAEPDRCKKACPAGTVADADSVCKPSQKDALISALTTPGALGIIALTSVAAILVIRGGLR